MSARLDLSCRIALLFGLLCFGTYCVGCSAATLQSSGRETLAAEDAQVEGATTRPTGDSLSLFELVPAEADGAALVHVARLRKSSHGPALTNMVRRIGAFEWEGALGVDLRTEVERVLVFGIMGETQAPGDLSAVIDVVRQVALGAVVELQESAVEGESECFEGELAGLEGRLLPEPASGMTEYRCGRFVIVHRTDVSWGLGPHRDSPLTSALSALEGAGELNAQTVFFAIASPELLDRVSCGDATVSLRGWQVVTVELGEGMTLYGRYHAANMDQVAQLQRCVGDGMGGFSDVPLFAQLELRDVLQNATVAPDANTPGDVLLEASFTEGELDLMLGLLELVGAGIQ